MKSGPSVQIVEYEDGMFQAHERLLFGAYGNLGPRRTSFDDALNDAINRWAYKVKAVHPVEPETT